MHGFRLVIAANGVAYLPHEARPGIVPRLLQEILSTRIMVKGAMKTTPASHKVLQVLLFRRLHFELVLAQAWISYTLVAFHAQSAVLWISHDLDSRVCISCQFATASTSQIAFLSTMCFAFKAGQQAALLVTSVLSAECLFFVPYKVCCPCNACQWQGMSNCSMPHDKAVAVACCSA